MHGKGGEDETLRFYLCSPYLALFFFSSFSFVDWGGRQTKAPLETMRRRFTIWKGGKDKKKNSRNARALWVNHPLAVVVLLLLYTCMQVHIVHCTLELVV
ncbi:hypothetical protein B0T22DRAFT_448124 [Podospora appendiculata]|uniref:Transmembrane protein n=1 Tax=Podospora appendiculata TaxID=314037 RepID=A0AAE0XG52_9PEZI|nr:hypothetical protein B0T22DRAFT_448124 [Podospora appendiculata]